MTSNTPVLEVKDLKKHFPVKKGLLRRTVGHVYAVDGITFTIGEGETLGLVGESGCGKTTAGRAVLRLIEPTSGSVKVEGKEITGLNKVEMRPYRRDMQIVFQDPFSSLNPRMTAGDIVAEPLQVHGVTGRKDRRDKVAALFERVGLRAAQMANYPHQFSGGQRQRLLIAAALACAPQLVIADEPTTALDVTTQHQILLLLRELVGEFGISLLFVTHDFGVVAELCDELCVIYAGQTVERGSVQSILAEPAHPYTKALLACHPDRATSFVGIPGLVPSPLARPAGCLFAPRCLEARPVCREASPGQGRAASGAAVRCVQFT